MDLLKIGREIGAEAERMRLKLRLVALVADVERDIRHLSSAFRFVEPASLGKLRAAVDELAHPSTPAPSSPSVEQP